MPCAAAVKEETVALPADFEPGARDAIPAEGLADGDAEFFGADDFLIEAERDDAAGFTAPIDGELLPSGSGYAGAG